MEKRATRVNERGLQVQVYVGVLYTVNYRWVYLIQVQMGAHGSITSGDNCFKYMWEYTSITHGGT